MSDFGKALLDFVDQEKGEGIVVATVASVDEENRVFNAVDLAGNELSGIRLQAVAIAGGPGFFVLPAVGSDVLISAVMHSDTEDVLLASSKVDAVVAQSSRVDLGNGALEQAVLGAKLNAQLSQLNSNIVSLTQSLQSFAQTGATAAGASPTTANLAPAYSALIASLASVNTALQQWPQKLPDHLAENVKIS